MKTNPNHSINSCIETGGISQIYTSEIGLTKREYFAAKALQGILSNSNVSITKGTSGLAVILADKLIEALNKKEDEK